MSTKNYRNNVQAFSGNADTIAAGAVVPGNSLAIDQVMFGTLSATVTMEAETNTITLAFIWQVSNDGSTWTRVAESPNTAPVVFGTGTAGDDPVVTRVVSAPEACYGWRFVRGAALVGVTTGAAVDTVAIAYNYQQDANW